MGLKMIPNFPAYCVNKNGEIWSSRNKRFLRLTLNNAEYFYIDLRKNSKPYRRLVHRLVLETFIGPCPKRMECCHKNGMRADNRLNNLR